MSVTKKVILQRHHLVLSLNFIELELLILQVQQHLP